MNLVKKFKELDLLDYILNKFVSLRPPDASHIYIVSLQHLLETTGSLFESILGLGIPPGNIFVSGKIYSNNEKTISKLRRIGINVEDNSKANKFGDYYSILRKDSNNLWKKLEGKLDSLANLIIVLDDGGILLSSVPAHLKNKLCIIGIEQTTSGIELNKECKVPIISVAGSAIKKYVEPAFISQAVIQKARRYFLNYRPKKVGVIGYGNIGKSLVKDLCNHKGIKVLVYDHDFSKKDRKNSVIFCESVNDIFYHADLIIGATGKDVSSRDWLLNCKSNKVLISVSSGDIEFQDLIKNANEYLTDEFSSMLDDIRLNTKDNCRIIIPRGGTPINFDNNKHSVLPEHIQITRGLLLLGVLQAIYKKDHLCGKDEVVKLNVLGQHEILKYWSSKVNLKKFEFTIPLITILNSPNFIEEHSQGMKI